MKKIEASLVRQLFTLLLIILIGYLIFRETLPYFSGVLGAITLYIMFQKWMKKLVQRGWSRSLSAVSLMIFSFIVILLPILGIASMLGSKIGEAVRNSEKFIEVLKDQITRLKSTYQIDIISQIDTSKITGLISNGLSSIAGNTMNMFIAIGLMYFLLYYMLYYFDRLKAVFEDYIPLDNDNIDLIEVESTKMVKANAIGIPLVAVCQGIIALIGFLIFGVPNPFFWFVITAVGSMIPFVGTLIGIVPAAILLFAAGQTWQGVALLIYGAVVVGSTDNIIRLSVLRRLDDVHPLVTLVGVVVGVPLFGFMGLIFGPLMISLFMLIVKIYKKEYGEKVVVPVLEEGEDDEENDFHD